MKRFCFNRLRDSKKISKLILNWDGPYCLKGFEDASNLNVCPDIEGVYIFCIKYNNGYVLESAGHTKSTKKRLAQHLYNFKVGKYTILDSNDLDNLIRTEVWHGWSDYNKYKEHFIKNKTYYISELNKFLSKLGIFIYKNCDKRIRERIEAAIMIDSYYSKEVWSDITPRWMQLRGRLNEEIPISAKNIFNSKIYGINQELEI